MRPGIGYERLEVYIHLPVLSPVEPSPNTWLDLSILNCLPDCRQDTTHISFPFSFLVRFCFLLDSVLFLFVFLQYSIYRKCDGRVIR